MAAMREELLKIWPSGIRTIVDLGCRDCWHTAGLPGVEQHVGVEVWKPALNRGIEKAAAGHIPNFEPVCDDALKFLSLQNEGTYDAVLAIDLIEHIQPTIAGAVLHEMARVARRLTVVWTTLGMIKQGPHDVDGGHNPFEQHVWGPTSEAFEALGWAVRCYPTWHQERGGAILAWLLKG